MAGEQDTRGGLYRAFKRRFSFLLAVAQTRLELLATELVEERHRVTLILANGVAAVFLLCFGALLLVATLTVAFWEQRLVILGGATLIFLAGGAMAIRNALYHARLPSSLFAASLAELTRDRAKLREPD